MKFVPGYAELEMSVGEYLELSLWFCSAPQKMQDLFSAFPPGSRWRLREGTWSARRIQHAAQDDCFVPTAFVSNGMIEMIRIDTSTNTPLLGAHRVRPLDLAPAYDA